MKSKLLGISLITISLLYGLLAGIAILVCYFSNIPILYAIVLSIIILIVQFLISPFITDITMRWLYQTDFNAEIPDYLKSFIQKTCDENKMKYPKVGIINDGAPNAFTYGRTKNSARVVLTRGIFNLLNEEEVKAVVAHELGHAIHYDMMFMTFAQLVPLVLYAIYELTIENKGKDDDSKSQMIGYIAYILYIICQYIILWLSRTREYYADDFAIDATKNPNALAEALVKIGYGLSTNKTENKHSVAKKNTLGIFDPNASKSLVVNSYENGGVSKDKIIGAMKWEMWNIWAKIYELNSTHPLISKRLQAITKRSKEFNQTPYIEFNLKKPESYLDDFFIELFIKYLPTISFILALIIVVWVLVTNHNLAFINNITLPKVLGFIGIIYSISLFIRLNKTHKNKDYKETDVASLLGEVKVSSITSIPCILNGRIIGRGNPGYIFNEDFIIQDNSGIIFLDYNQPIYIVNKIFALFKSPEYMNKEITVKGWYRRSPVPYVEIYSYIIDGKEKKCHTYTFIKILYIIILIASIISLFL